VIDELGRTNRNVIESLRLNELVRRPGVRLVDASDSFDSANEQSKILLSMMATMHEMQIDQNASHVNRGIGDAFEQGRLVQPPGFGYRLVPFVDASGNPVKTRKGADAKRAEVDPEYPSQESHLQKTVGCWCVPLKGFGVQFLRPEPACVAVLDPADVTNDTPTLCT